MRRPGSDGGGTGEANSGREDVVTASFHRPTTFRTAPLAALAVLLLLGAPSARGADGPARARDLEAALGAIVAESALAGARAGILVASLETGQVLFARDADVLLNPASNVKLFTAAAALARLGPEYRFDTEFYADAGSEGRTSLRTLFVRGKGDPTITSERLWAIAGDLDHAGVKKVGDIVLDDLWFDGERLGPGFDQESGDRSYLAPTGALSLDWNAVAVHVAPGDRPGARARVELEPASDFLEVVNRATTAGPRAMRRVLTSSSWAGGRQRVSVDGRVPAGGRETVVWRRIDEPALYLGQTLRRYLELRGVKVTGRVRTGALPPDARLVHVAESEPLAEVVRRMNKVSSNFVAEQLVKALGAEAKGAPGSWAKGIEAVGDFLADAGIPRGAYVMRNGSGLNDSNRFSARQVVTLLRAMWQRWPLQAEFVGSLPVAGRDGTIRWRMEGTEAVGRLRAKTGTLENVASLSGYVETASREKLVFAALVNDYPGRAAGVVRALDALGSALAASGGGAAGLSAAVALAAPTAAGPVPAAAVAAGDLRATVKTYYGLGRAGDRRHVAFLRTALRTERHPALRLAIAECVYLADPDGDSARRAFLDAVAGADAAALTTLFAAAPEGAPPVLPSLGDLAFEAGGEALVRLVELSAAATDPAVAAAYDEVLSEVASGAPEDLLLALRAATPVAADAAVASLGRSLSRAGAEGHPFPPAVAAVAATDGEPGAFARALEARLRDAEATARAPRIGPAPAAIAAPAAEAPQPRPGG